MSCDGEEERCGHDGKDGSVTISRKTRIIGKMSCCDMEKDKNNQKDELL